MENIEIARRLWERNRGTISIPEDEFFTTMPTVIRHMKLFGFDLAKVREVYRSLSQSDSDGYRSEMIEFVDSIDLTSLASQTCTIIKRSHARLLLVDSYIAAMFGAAFVARMLDVMGIGNIPEEVIRHLDSVWVFGFVCFALLVTAIRIAVDLYWIIRTSQAIRKLSA